MAVETADQYSDGAKLSSFHLKVPIHALCSEGDCIYAGDEVGNIYEFNTVERKEPTSVMKEHSSRINSLLAVQGVLFSASDDATVKIWDTNEKVCSRTIIGHEGPVLAMYLSPEGRLFTGGCDAAVNEWDPKTATRKWIIAGSLGRINCIISSTIFTGFLFSAGTEKIIRCWNSSNGKCILTFHGHTDAVTSLCTYENLLLSSSSDGSVRVWDGFNGTCLNCLESKSSLPLNFVFVYNNNLLTGGEDQLSCLSIVDRNSNILFEGHEGEITMAIPFYKSNSFVTAGLDGRIIFWRSPINGDFEVNNLDIEISDKNSVHSVIDVGNDGDVDEISRLRRELADAKSKLEASEMVIQDFEEAKAIIGRYNNELQTIAQAHIDSLQVVLKNSDRQLQESAQTLNNFKRLLERAVSPTSNVPVDPIRTWENDSDWDSDLDIDADRCWWRSENISFNPSGILPPIAHDPAVMPKSKNNSTISKRVSLIDLLSSDEGQAKRQAFLARKQKMLKKRSSFAGVENNTVNNSEILRRQSDFDIKSKWKLGHPERPERVERKTSFIHISTSNLYSIGEQDPKTLSPLSTADTEDDSFESFLSSLSGVSAFTSTKSSILERPTNTNKNSQERIELLDHLLNSTVDSKREEKYKIANEGILERPTSTISQGSNDVLDSFIAKKTKEEMNEISLATHEVSIISENEDDPEKQSSKE